MAQNVEQCEHAIGHGTDYMRLSVLVIGRTLGDTVLNKPLRRSSHFSRNQLFMKHGINRGDVAIARRLYVRQMPTYECESGNTCGRHMNGIYVRIASGCNA